MYEGPADCIGVDWGSGGRRVDCGSDGGSRNGLQKVGLAVVFDLVARHHLINRRAQKRVLPIAV